MNTMALNKVFAAILCAGIAFMLTGQLGKVLVYAERPHHSAIKVAMPEPAAPTGGAPAAAEPIAALLASADVEAGQRVANQQCAACHSFNEGGRHGVGPNLYGIIGAPHGHAQGFAYSAALKGKQGPWTYDEMNAWLWKPSVYAPGTRMAYPGLANTQSRANVVAYLRTLAKDPQPLPPAGQPQAAATPAAATAPAATQSGPTGNAQTAAARTQATGPAAQAAAGDQLPPVAPLLAQANAGNGQQLFQRQCAVCHTVNEGGRNGVGPNLWNVIGADIANHEGYTYSAALKGKDGPWNYEEMNRWLHRPMQYVPGTRMAFVGLNDAQQRADVIAYLRSLAKEPQPLPTN